MHVFQLRNVHLKQTCAILALRWEKGSKNQLKYVTTRIRHNTGVTFCIKSVSDITHARSNEIEVNLLSYATERRKRTWAIAMGSPSKQASKKKKRKKASLLLESTILRFFFTTNGWRFRPLVQSRSSAYTERERKPSKSNFQIF